LQQEVPPTLKCTYEKLTYQESVVFFHKVYLTFSTTEQEISSLKPAGVFPLRTEMIKETDFEKNYAATKMNKRGCCGKSRQNKSVTTMQPGFVSPESKVLRLLPMSQIKV
jgi:hypothetical protein